MPAGSGGTHRPEKRPCENGPAEFLHQDEHEVHAGLAQITTKAGLGYMWSTLNCHQGTQTAEFYHSYLSL